MEKKLTSNNFLLLGNICCLCIHKGQWPRYIYTIVFLGIFYYILISSYVTPYRMVINEEYIEAKLILKKDTHIPMRDIIKIRLENHSYQVLKNYTLFVHTCNKEYRFPTHLFNCKELNVYLADLCQEKGIEYYFKK